MNDLLKEVNSLYQTNMKAFFLRSFYTLHPFENSFMDNWHISLILEYLSAIHSGQIKRLIINMPPRHLKSFCASVFFPSWVMAHNPEKKIILCSYSKHISTKHNQEIRHILSSKWFNSAFPSTVIASGENTKEKFSTTKHGSIYATSVNASLTGDGGDYLILDDPQTPMQALSKAHREKTFKWFSATFTSRLNDKKNGAIIVIMQRLHKEDLTGYLSSKNSWEQLKIPGVAKRNEFISFNNFKYQRSEGEVIHPQREDKSDMKLTRQDLGTDAFLAQYQQEPVDSTHALIKKKWIGFYDELPKNIRIFQSWDTAITKSEKSDYSVCITVGVNENQFFLINVFRKKLGYIELKNAFLKMFEQYQPSSVLIEAKASGEQLIQEASKMTTIPILAYQPKFNKLSRLYQVIGIFESGKILIPKNSVWESEFVEELTSFPDSKHDDQVDSLTQFLNWYHVSNIQNKWAIRFV